MYWSGPVTCWPGGPFHERFFNCNSNLMEVSFRSHPCGREVIAMRFCTGHHSCAVASAAKFCSDIIPYNGVTLKTNFSSNLNFEGKIVHEVPRYITPCVTQLPNNSYGAKLCINPRHIINSLRPNGTESGNGLALSGNKPFSDIGRTGPLLN